jgi:hypothetical protein
MRRHQAGAHRFVVTHRVGLDNRAMREETKGKNQGSADRDTRPREADQPARPSTSIAVSGGAEGGVLIARSSLECRLYIQLHPCSCGEMRGVTQHRIESRDEALLAVYEGRCMGCAVPRRFDFVLDPEIPPSHKFGGSKCSLIIDAGEFLAVADAAVRAVANDANRLDDLGRQRARSLLLRAVAALEEVLKFIPPDGDRVPVEALWSAAGKEQYLMEPGRFRGSRLEKVLGVYRTAVTKLSGGGER